MKYNKGFKYKIGDIVGSLEITGLVKKPMGNSKYNYKVCLYKCVKCSYSGEKREDSLASGSSCPCCNNKIVVEHINSIVANEETHWMVDYFAGGWNEAKLYTYGYREEINAKCPYCKRIQNKTISICTIYRQGISCEFCGSGKPYPERFLAALLSECNIEYIEQLTKRTKKWCDKFQYDFYIPEYDMIIETHGGQHYFDTQRTSVEDVRHNDKIKKELALKNVQSYVVLDCRKSDRDWIKNSIIKSELSLIIDLQNIDWVDIDFKASSSTRVEIWNYWKDNMYKESLTSIGKRFSLSRVSIKKILSKGNELGIIEFDEKKIIRMAQIVGSKNAGIHNKKKVSVFKDGKIIKTYDGTVDLVRESEKDLGVRFASTSVSRYINTNKEYKGYIITNTLPETTKRENIQNG